MKAADVPITVTSKIPEELASQLALLREPFPPETIGKLPRVTDRDSAKSKCQVCGAFIGRHIHLDYVGHAEVTDRLLSIDPLWNWEPLAYDETGLPRFVVASGRPVELWIKLTVCGVTRIGVGSVSVGQEDAAKQLISDALRNAAMRFGVALDLWAKSELESRVVIDEVAPDEQPATTPKPAAPTAPKPPAEDRPADVSAEAWEWCQTWSERARSTGLEKPQVAALVSFATKKRIESPRYASVDERTALDKALDDYDNRRLEIRAVGNRYVVGAAAQPKPQAVAS